MALQITPDTIPGYILSDESRSFSVSYPAGATNTPTDHDTFWDADYPLFSNPIGDTVSVVMAPRSCKTTVRAYKIKKLTAGNTISKKNNVTVTTTGNGSMKQTAANQAETPWDAFYIMKHAPYVKDGVAVEKFFVDGIAIGNTGNKCIGFKALTTAPIAEGGSGSHTLDSTTAINPYSSKIFGFYLKSDKKFFIVVDGSPVNSAPLWYSDGDRFKVERDGASLKFSKNGVVIYKTAFIPSVTQTVNSVTTTSTLYYYPFQSYNSYSASADNGFSRTVVFGASAYTANYSAVTNAIQIYGVCPGQPQYSYKINRDNITLVSQAEDGSATYRKKSKARITMSLQYNQRPYDEFKTMLDFWNHHERHIPFIYRDIGPYTSSEHVEYLVRFENQLEYTIEGPNSVTWSLAIREV